MPHHESGLLALHTTDPEVIDCAAAYVEHPDVELVRAADGKAVWLCFGSYVDSDASAFLDTKKLGRLAKKLGLPLWVGHAIGGYSNVQTVMHFSAAGKRGWVDTFDFNFPPSVQAEANDPFTSPERRYELVQHLRASRGYGRIGTEFGLDYFRVLCVDAGDPLFATDKKRLGTQSSKQFADWLNGPYVSPEGEPGDGAEPPAPVDRVAYRFTSLPSVEPICAALAHLLTQRGVNAKASELRSGTETVLKLEGRGLRAVSSTLVAEEFVNLLATVGGSVFAYGWDAKESPTLRHACARGEDAVRFFSLSRKPLALEGRFKPVPLTVSKAQVRQLDQLRKELACGED